MDDPTDSFELGLSFLPTDATQLKTLINKCIVQFPQTRGIFFRRRFLTKLPDFFLHECAQDNEVSDSKESLSTTLGSRPSPCFSKTSWDN